jgi:FdhD protein
VSEPIFEHQTLKWRDREAGIEPDRLAVEEPLEIRLGGRRFTLTMRTPGHDEELAAGFLLAEGFVTSRAELGEIRQVRGAKGVPDPNVLDIILTVPAARLRERLKRNFAISSSCGVCGKTSIEAIQRRLEPISTDLHLSSATVIRLPSLMREAQAVFAATGGLHAAALFAAGIPARNGDEVELSVLREDVGRHNAVDKVIGYALMHDLIPLSEAVIMVSGRLSFEIVQKTAAAGVPILCAVSAPSSLAVELAEEVGITLIGFVRERGFNVYTHAHRIPPEDPINGHRA